VIDRSDLTSGRVEERPNGPLEVQHRRVHSDPVADGVVLGSVDEPNRRDGLSDFRGLGEDDVLVEGVRHGRAFSHIASSTGLRLILQSK
jgi:hypothetical protein